MISDPPIPGEKRVQGNWLIRLLKRLFRYVNHPFLLSYRGYGHDRSFRLQGHVFRGMAESSPSRHKRSPRNILELIKMFLVRTIPSARVALPSFTGPGGQMCIVHTDDCGYFEFEVHDHHLPPGWHKIRVKLIDHEYQKVKDVYVDAEVLIIGTVSRGIISDIDDTVLVSHIGSTWRNAYLLTTRSSSGRKPFQGTVDFYRSLTGPEEKNRRPLFYVSSSEWNLYEFLLRFMRFHKLPKGILQLREIKDSWRDFFQAENRNHRHKLEKIERILNFFPKLEFILLGDNTQHDPRLYREIALRNPQQVCGVYIRNVRRKHRAVAQEELDHIQENTSIPTYQFSHSRDAQEHARREGITSGL